MCVFKCVLILVYRISFIYVQGMVYACLTYLLQSLYQKRIIFYHHRSFNSTFKSFRNYWVGIYWMDLIIENTVHIYTIHITYNVFLCVFMCQKTLSKPYIITAYIFLRNIILCEFCLFVFKTNNQPTFPIPHHPIAALAKK